jgi:hypothetical protein
VIMTLPPRAVLKAPQARVKFFHIVIMRVTG